LRIGASVRRTPAGCPRGAYDLTQFASRSNSADFLDQLIKKLPPNVAKFQHRASRYTQHEDGVTIHFEDEKLPPAEADVVVCSDGIKSLLRGHMYQQLELDMESQKARYAEWIAWRGLVPREKYNEIFGEGAVENIMHVGTGRHILSESCKHLFPWPLPGARRMSRSHSQFSAFPVRGGSLINIVRSPFFPCTRPADDPLRRSRSSATKSTRSWATTRRLGASHGQRPR
jgi:2-polyprenyl-6-methoxyphenol hydroxylase-like FAD-dependent oxidoreductase